MRLRDCVVILICVVLALSAAAEDPNPPSLHSKGGAWPLLRQWNRAEQRHFSKWIEHIYDVKCHGTRDQYLAKLERILTDPEMNLLLESDFSGECNPQLDTETMRAMHAILDCAKLTVALGTYYAYRRGLPWMQAYVRASDDGDLRTAEYTIPCGSSSSMDFSSPHDFMVEALHGICTGNFRVELNRRNSGLSDTVPVAIDKQHLIPGCLFYLDGHVLILAHIDPYGEPHFLDATTAASRDIYTHNGLNAVTGITPKHNHGAPFSQCYHGFRVQRFPIAEVDGNGQVRRVRRRTDAEMKEFGFSPEQYEKMQELTERQGIAERVVDREGVAHDLKLDTFHKFVMNRLRSVDHVSPVAYLADAAKEMLATLRLREQGVQNAWRDVRDHGPITFPEDQGLTNIFNAGGRWGARASTILDIIYRTKYFEMQDWLDNAIDWFDLLPEFVDLDGLNKNAIWTSSDLAVAILKEKDRVFSAATFTYTNSSGAPVQLSLLDVERRIYDLSFDPNHPPELRWGAMPGSDEAKTAPETPTPVPHGAALAMAETFRREAYYRCVAQREVEETSLRKMFTEGFPVRDKFDARLASRYMGRFSPPLVPHNGKLAWLREQHN